MAKLIDRNAPFRLPRPDTPHFAALAESILYQQLAGAAAAAIHRRFVALFDGDLSPGAVLALSARRLAPRDSRGARSPPSEISRRRSWMGPFGCNASAGSRTRTSSRRCR